MDKEKVYHDLVDKRKHCKMCNGLCNPSSGQCAKFDSSQIGPWSLWQANLNSRIVIVGQDWGDVSYFTKWHGKDQPSGNPTNENLQELLLEIGIKIEKPQDYQEHRVFLTNLVLCLKSGGLQAPIDDQWLKNCSQYFFKPLISLIEPKIIICLGQKTSESILNIYRVSYSKGKFADMLAHSPFRLPNSTFLFPVYHCGAGSVNRNRNMLQQKNDWQRINRWIQKNEINL